MTAEKNSSCVRPSEGRTRGRNPKRSQTVSLAGSGWADRGTEARGDDHRTVGSNEHADESTNGPRRAIADSGGGWRCSQRHGAVASRGTPPVAKARFFQVRAQRARRRLAPLEGLRLRADAQSPDRHARGGSSNARQLAARGTDTRRECAGTPREGGIVDHRITAPPPLAAAIAA